jgi:glycosidase
MGVLGTDTAFSEFEQDELDKPFPRKELLDRTIYVSQPMRITKGLPSLCDLSEARFNSPENHDLVMPDAYRAPEVVLDMPWSYPIDVWGFAMTVRDAFQQLE